jgi:hypothetical protein
MNDLLSPERAVEPRPAGRDTSRYVRSYLIMRVFVGALGVALPIALVLGDGLVLGGEPFPRSSLSAYYYSGVRDVFVGTLSAIGVFLVTYKVAERTLDNTLSTLAGIAVGLVALLPTGVPAGEQATPLQELLGESTVETIHYVSAAVFIGSLALIRFFFGVREGSRPHLPGRRSPAFWRWFHWACGAAIVASLLWIAVTELAGGPGRSLLIGQWVAVWAFGASWLAKGLELDFLSRRAESASADSARVHP